MFNCLKADLRNKTLKSPDFSLKLLPLEKAATTRQGEDNIKPREKEHFIALEFYTFCIQLKRIQIYNYVDGI